MRPLKIYKVRVTVEATVAAHSKAEARRHALNIDGRTIDSDDPEEWGYMDPIGVGAARETNEDPLRAYGVHD